MIDAVSGRDESLKSLLSTIDEWHARAVACARLVYIYIYIYMCVIYTRIEDIGRRIPL